MGYPTAADAGNLLLSYLSGERTTTIGRAVPVVRNARFDNVGVGGVDVGGDAEPLPPIPLFEGLDRKHRFGQVLDRMLDQWSKAGGLEGGVPGAFLSAVFLCIDEGAIGFKVELHLHQSSRDLPPDYVISYWDARDARSLKRRQDGRDLITRRVVSDTTLAAFSRCLSDGPVVPAPDLEHLDDAKRVRKVRRRR